MAPPPAFAGGRAPVAPGKRTLLTGVAAIQECRSLLDVSWLLLLVVVALAVGAAWFVRLLQIEITPVAASVFVYALLYVAAARSLDRLKTPRTILLATSLLHGSGILFLALLWHLVGGIEARVFLLAFLLPVLATGIVMRDWRPYVMALVAVVSVTLVSLAESPELRWYVSLWGLPLEGFSWEGPAWMPRRPRPFPGAEVLPEELLVSLGMFAVFQLSAAALSESISGLVLRLSDRLRTADDLREEAQGLFQAVMHADPSPSVIVYRDTGQILYTSQSFLQQLLLSPTDLLGKGLFDVVRFHEPERVREILARGEGELGSCGHQVGSEARIASVRVFRIDHGGTSYAYLGFSDLTEMYYLNAVLDGMQDALLVLDEEGKLLYANELTTRLFPEAHFGMNMAALLSAHEERGWWRTSGPEETEKKVRLRGQSYRASMIGATLPGGKSWATIATLRSTTEEDKLYDMATHDPLTKIYNRRFFEEALPGVIARVDRGARAALASLDMDYFKEINDDLGHAAGDEALVLFTKTVREQLRTADIFARLGGDEFAVIFTDTGAAEAYEVIQRIYRNLAKRPLEAGGQSRVLGFSSGVASIHAGDRLPDLLIRVDEALYAAKEAGRGRCEARE